MAKFSYFLFVIVMCLFAACSSHRLPAFANQQWHIDRYSGNAVSSSGIELAFGSEWMITDTTLMQTSAQVADFPKLESHLANGIARFPEIEVDSVLFYNPSRGLLFVTYHQVKPLKPTSEIFLYDGTTAVYSEEYARLFGLHDTSVDDTGWENGPTNSVYSNVRYIPRHRQLVQLQRIPGKDNIGVFQIWTTDTKSGKWTANYPKGSMNYISLGHAGNIERISATVQSSRNLAVENLKLTLSRQE